MVTFPSQPRALGGSHLDTLNGGYRYVTIGAFTFEASDVVALVLDHLEPLDSHKRAQIDMAHGETPMGRPSRLVAPLLEI
jgi:hypothetical protein